MEELRFSHNYDKLYHLVDGHRATTIRRRKKFNTGDQVKVLHCGSFLCYAKIGSIQKLTIREISTIELIDDVAPNANTREAAIEFVSNFYQVPITERSVVHFISFRRINEAKVVKQMTLTEGVLST
ncbi:MAG: hypothetical protein GPJ51_08365 [Candidatus Heimdallarchaeota archaeon]|nr:hypothetical protein [Candidatus Heimdallarchaeota archaeon]